jgi:hypothetical protein
MLALPMMSGYAFFMLNFWFWSGRERHNFVFRLTTSNYTMSLLCGHSGVTTVVQGDGRGNRDIIGFFATKHRDFKGDIAGSKNF